ncbi:hypothetical protein BDP27DRAFT_1401067 [Rhodocollybia butyracea]|uniref:Uncharacterized protein n=1 Tax=Rhodocollybia butyracea TaxID=206335 RepID=A0A9P5PZL4_9AGAR|nr:hypothetical protein BDP27DRAFT_1401067 [Rhodocollybia butyracea]
MSFNPHGLTLPAEAILGLKVILVDIMVSSLWFGVQGVVTVIAIYILLSRGQSTSSGTRFLVGIILILFCTSACSLALTLWDYMTRMDTFGDPTSTPFVSKADVILMVLQRLSYFTSDSIVVWRAWVLWDRNIFVKVLLVVCLLGTITASFAQGALSVTRQDRQINGVPTGSGFGLALMFSLPFLFTNLTSTALIAAKIWEYRRNIVHHLSTSSNRVFGILLILLESSILYLVFWILALMAAFNIIPPIGLSAIMGSLPYVTAIYPVMIVVLVTIDKSNYGSAIQTTNTTTRFTSVFRHPTNTATTFQ